MQLTADILKALIPSTVLKQMCTAESLYSICFAICRLSIAELLPCIMWWFHLSICRSLDICHRYTVLSAMVSYALGTEAFISNPVTGKLASWLPQFNGPVVHPKNFKRLCMGGQSTPMFSIKYSRQLVAYCYKSFTLLYSNSS